MGFGENAAKDENRVQADSGKGVRLDVRVSRSREQASGVQASIISTAETSCAIYHRFSLIAMKNSSLYTIQEHFVVLLVSGRLQPGKAKPGASQSVSLRNIYIEEALDLTD